jgi:glucose/arabinose dehydrogenase
MFPAAYRGALFFADVARQCIFVVQPGEDGVPDPRTARQFARSTFPVDMAVGPDGALYYVNVLHGELRRITYRV